MTTEFWDELIGWSLVALGSTLAVCFVCIGVAFVYLT